VLCGANDAHYAAAAAGVQVDKTVGVVELGFESMVYHGLAVVELGNAWLQVS